MTLEEARKVFEQYDGILLDLFLNDRETYSRFQDSYIFSEPLEQWRRELIEKAYEESRPLSRILAMIREAKEDQEEYADRFLEELLNSDPADEEKESLISELVNDSDTCGYNWLQQYAKDLEGLQEYTEKLISGHGESLLKRFETLTK